MPPAPRDRQEGRRVRGKGEAGPGRGLQVRLMSGGVAVRLHAQERGGVGYITRPSPKPYERPETAGMSPDFASLRSGATFLSLNFLFVTGRPRPCRVESEGGAVSLSAAAGEATTETPASTTGPAATSRYAPRFAGTSPNRSHFYRTYALFLPPHLLSMRFF